MTSATLPYSAEVIELAVPVEMELFCSICLEIIPFVVEREYEDGRMGRCKQCKDERRIPFSRAISEVA